MARPTILVTGASGFVGRNLVEYLRAEGSAKILAGTRNPDGENWVGSDSVEAIKFDLCDLQIMQEIFDHHRPTHIVNCAAYGVNPAERDAGIAYRTNVQGPLELLRLSKKNDVKRFVQIGSCWEYGPKDDLIEETMPLNPIGIYSSTKAAASLLLPEIANSIDQDLIVLRLFGVWGPCEPVGRLVPQILDAAKTGKTLDLSAGYQIRDFSYAPELVASVARLALLAQPMPHRIFNIGTGRGISVRDFAGKFARELDCEKLLKFGLIGMGPDEVPSHVADIKRLVEMLGEPPQILNSEQISDLISAHHSCG